jgi:cytochrome c553
MDTQSSSRVAASARLPVSKGLSMSVNFRRAMPVYPALIVSSALLVGWGLPNFFSPVVAAPSGQDQAASRQAPTPDQAVFFNQRIQPILVQHCYDCHSIDTRAAGQLLLDDRDSILTGGKSGPAINIEHVEDSVLLHRLQEKDPKKRMPKGEADPLSAAEIADLKAWIAQGAPWPANQVNKEASTSGDRAPALKPASLRFAKAIPYPRPATAEQLAWFEKNVRPILVNRCYNCHSDAFKEAGGLRVDIGIAIFTGGNDGPVIVPGDPEKSLLIERIKSDDAKKRMPQESTESLPAEEVAILEKWIRDGAAWPDETEKLPQTPARIAANYAKLRLHHWSWQPLTDPAVPRVENTAWSDSNIDRFVLAKLEEKKLTPVKDADPVTLIRRLSYDLTGLPPTPADVKAFQLNHSPAAYSRLVDRFLASPQFGERWGRHWLDVARYAESSGPSRNLPYPNAWRYRDYVIDAFNRDIPYNRFIQEQLAGDLLPAENSAERDRLLIATGFLALGPKDVNQRFKARFKMDNVDDQIDTVTRSTMALTVTCARCHDHKFDPILTTDYYALASIFTSTDDAAGVTSRMGGASLQYYDPRMLGYLSTADRAAKAPADHVEKLKAQVAVAKKAFDEMVAKDAEDQKANPNRAPYTKEQKKQRAEITRNFTQLKEDLQLINDLGELGYGVHSAREGIITDTSVRIRGVEERHGPVVPRGYLSLINLKDAPSIPADHSGRLELAQWITDPENPLTARVYANRVWQHLFGVGIVNTVDNFGSMGDHPSNPQLLDHLAQDFIRNGWSTKKLVREIVLTRAYQLGTEIPAGYKEIDPADRLIWRHAPRRLETEEIRDSILSASGQLDLNHPNGSPSMALRMIEVRDDGPAVKSILDAADRSRYRSIYLPQLRGEVPRPLAAFDPVSQTLVTGQREETTVPTQALFMLNSPFIREQSLSFASTLLATGRASDADRIRTAYERVLSRDPSAQDVDAANAFLSRYAAAWSKAHPQPSKDLKPHIVAINTAPFNVTAGIMRSDNLGQDDPDDTTKQTAETAPSIATAENPRQAAWAAFVQSLFGSAEFQFVR